ncbi:MAG TPA: HAMP domain-containing sensor histidine kinase [Thermoanaerobaculia bacterium]|nr:HAMP domain-containing sensor histidine kinase [Thermoanaerobaculia bacterium]
MPSRQIEPRPERRSVWRVGPESTWTTVIPVAFIIASLISLVILPIVVSNHTRKLRQEIQKLAEPARKSANQAQIDIASELDKLIAWHVTGQDQFRREYVQLVASERANFAVLRDLSTKLGGDSSEKLLTLMNTTTQWHARVNEGELATNNKLVAEVFLERLFTRHKAYDQALTAAGELENALQAAINDRLQNIRRAERLSIWLTIILTVLALTSALLVAGLGRQMRLLAREAMRRRQEAEREASEAKMARAAAEHEERRAAFLASAGQELAASLDYAQTIATLAKLIVANLAEMSAVDIAESDGTMRRATIAHRDPHREQELAAATAGASAREVPEAIVRVMQEREPRVIGSASSIASYLWGDADAQRSLLALPLVSRGQTLGIVLAAAPEGKVFTREDALLAGDLARHASLAIDNARLYLESQQAVRAREEVLAIVSHDLRNPLNAITLAASMLRGSDVSDEDREQLEIISLSAKRMSRLIQDLLDVTRLEGGKKLPIEPARIEVEPLLHEAHELFKVQAAASSITLLHEAQNVPAIRADKHRVMQVLSNLIGNAMKFTPAGGTISCRARSANADVIFTVSDTGSGIPREHLNDIFNPYWQAKRTERLGAGLGLSITKGIVEAHGGRIWVESQPGLGTTFSFTLPRDNDDAEEETAGATRRAESRARR